VTLTEKIIFDIVGQKTTTILVQTPLAGASTEKNWFVEVRKVTKRQAPQ
jgi:hypothetical protein